jgi:DNA invertase Pin-like site-specific DNA recombinase
VQNRVRPLALGYVRVSTADQVEHGASLDAQRAELTAEAVRRGWDLEIVADEGVSGKNLHRPGMQEALRRLDAHEADQLLAVRLDRVSRSVADFAGLLDRSAKHGWGLVMLSPSLDLSDPSGRFTANVLAAMAQFERELIGARTREGMAQRRAEGVHCGRPRLLPMEVVSRIVRMRDRGLSLRRIADVLSDEGVRTAHGGRRWWPATVRGVLMSEAARQ